MPVGFLPDAEGNRLSAFPAEVPTEDLYAFFTLSGPDRATIPARSVTANRLEFAFYFFGDEHNKDDEAEARRLSLADH